MLFNSFQFFLFFSLIWILYLCFSYRYQNILLLAASYFFYAYWDFRFLSLLLLTSVVDYFAALFIFSTSTPKQKKVFLLCSIIVNLSILCFFKYFNFFVDSFVDLMSVLGVSLSLLPLQIILPVGISFYTFKSMSYVIDVYRKETTPTRNFLDYALFVSFFPQLFAGPIERSSQLLSQIIKPRIVSCAKIQLGLFYLLWGGFLKVCVADNLARIVDPIFSGQVEQTGFTYLLAGYGYTFQIYGDFAGYSYMAMGFGTLLGFTVMNNFNLPYFAHNPQEFWRRWHISLSTWFRDYLYIPLGGSRGTSFSTIQNLLLTMLLCGLWHGAQVTFVLWGLFHGLLLAAHHMLKCSQLQTGQATTQQNVHSVFHYVKVVLFFHVIVVSWYLFRADSVRQIGHIAISMVTNFSFNPVEHSETIKRLLVFIVPLLLIEFSQYYRKDSWPIRQLPPLVRGLVYVLLVYCIIIFGVTDAQDFIYLQF